MSIAKRHLVVSGLVSMVLAACCGAGGCNNDNFSNPGVISAGPRFQLVIEEHPSAARLLLDSVSGDLWELRTDPEAGTQWVRIASGPTDARVLTPQEVLGMRSQSTPTP